MRAIVLYNPLNGKAIDNDDQFVDEDESPRIFDTIIAADSHSMWYELVYGIKLWAKLKSETSHR